jgi:hypothetical protein
MARRRIVYVPSGPPRVLAAEPILRVFRSDFSGLPPVPRQPRLPRPLASSIPRPVGWPLARRQRRMRHDRDRLRLRAGLRFSTTQPVRRIASLDTALRCSLHARSEPAAARRRAPSPREVLTWAAYNGILLALVPYVVFRLRGYPNAALSLKSSNLKNDVLIIVIILALGCALDFTGNSILQLEPHQQLVGRAQYGSVARGAASLMLVFLTFFPPGLMKSFLTIRTGNAWVHLWAYHAISPHVTIDTRLIVHDFNIK